METNSLIHQLTNKERKVSSSVVTESPAIRSMATQVSSITAEPNHSTKNQELQHLVCHTTPIRAIFHSFYR